MIALKSVGTGDLRLFQIRPGKRLLSSERTFFRNLMQLEREEGKGGIYSEIVVWFRLEQRI
jgi:hypothetical protein